MNLFNPYDPNKPLFTSRCSCGRHNSEQEHAQEASTKADEEKISADFIEASLVKALFPQEARRRAFLKAVGAGGALSALSGFCQSVHCRQWLKKRRHSKSQISKLDLSPSLARHHLLCPTL